MNILTGETGAGKCSILECGPPPLGDKATEEWIRSSEEEASVEALFDISGNLEVREKIKDKIPHLQGSGAEDSTLIHTVIFPIGQGKGFHGWKLWLLLECFWEDGEGLLSIYGQHEHQSLQRVKTHIDILINWGAPQLGGVLK